MRSFFSLILTTFIAVPAHAAEPVDALAAAMELPTSTAAVVSDIHPTLGQGAAQGMDVRSDLGVISAGPSGDMAVLFTGDVDNIEQLADFDHPPGGEIGDHATITIETTVPAGQDTLEFYFYFLSREWPEWVGDIYNDTFSVLVTGSA